MRKTSDHAIVFGASFAGLLTARVLAEFYKQVTVVERDALPPAGQHRKGVPQGRHLHGLHPRGREILDELLPDFTAELTAAGAVCCDVLADARWQLSGHQLKQRHAGLPALLASRPFLEGHVRERVDIPWDIAVGADLAFPHAPGPDAARAARQPAPTGPGLP